nr:MAG TPA: hypothetical protein [Caudoviricetes sp.]
MAELQRIKLQPGDLARYMNTWKEKPKALNVGAGSRYTGPSPIMKSTYGPSDNQTTSTLIQDLLRGNKDDPKNRFSIKIDVNKGVFDASRGNGSVDIVVEGYIDGIYTFAHQTDFSQANTDYIHRKFTVCDFLFIPIISGTNQMLLESSDGRPLFRGLVYGDSVNVTSPMYIYSVFANISKPYDFEESETSKYITSVSRNVGLYNERALTNMDFKILVDMIKNSVN